MKELYEALKLEEQYLYEMAIVNPKLCRQLTIQAEICQRDEGPIPHIHIFHDKTRNPKKCSCIRLDEVAYSPHHKSTIELPRKLKKEFIKLMTLLSNDFMEDDNGNVIRLNGYQSAVKTWVETYEDNYNKFKLDERGIPITLDYTKL